LASSSRFRTLAEYVGASEGILHICFSESGAGLLRESLRKAGRREAVIALPDDLRYGPIDPPDPEVRRAWMLRELSLTGRETAWLPGDVEGFWRLSLGFEGRRVVWTTRRRLDEHLGCLEWNWRTAGCGFDLADLTDVPWPLEREGGWPSGPPPMSIQSIGPDAFDLASLDREARPPSPEVCDELLELWRTLRAENAPLRVPDGDGARSAPLTHYDESLLADVPETWTPIGRVVGLFSAILHGWDHPPAFLIGTRVRALVAAGKLEGRGELGDLGDGQIRKVNT
jgi:hypothetical protein